MAERKVINKYYPPDFDPAAIPRRRMPKDQQVKVRLMTPFSMRCETCGDYIYKGKKFNARKELADGEDYLGIKIFRFYIKCPKCAAEITFKTDPKNADYLAEHGAVRNFEPWREEKITGEDTKLERELEEENDPMKALENRTVDSKREMDILDALDEIRTRNARNERMNAAVMDPLAKVPGASDDVDFSALVDGELLAQAEDEDLARAIFHTADNGDNVKRLDDEEESTNTNTPINGPDGNPFTVPALFTKKRKKPANESLEKFGVVIKKKTPSSSAKSGPPTVNPSPVLSNTLPKKATQNTTAPSILFGCYDSSSDNSDG